jgi:hypothetical protein
MIDTRCNSTWVLAPIETLDTHSPRRCSRRDLGGSSRAHAILYQ